MRDVAQMLPPLMTFWFFTTPILYSSEMLPDGLAQVLAWNPMGWFVGTIRDAVLAGRVDPSVRGAAVAAVTIALLWLSLRFFRRLSGHFEDFL